MVVCFLFFVAQYKMILQSINHNICILKHIPLQVFQMNMFVFFSLKTPLSPLFTCILSSSLYHSSFLLSVSPVTTVHVYWDLTTHDSSTLKCSAMIFLTSLFSRIKPLFILCILHKDHSMHLSLFLCILRLLHQMSVHRYECELLKIYTYIIILP